MSNIFDDLTVLEFGGGAAGPVATRYFADHGATVIRVESKQRPDFLRLLKFVPGQAGGLDAAEHFGVLNANKRSVAINLSDPRGVAVAKRLALWADCIAENFAPGAMKKWGLDYASLVQERPDLVMMDIVMPKRNGYEILRALKKDERTKKTPVVLVTSKTQQSDKDWGRRQGADEYITKPFTDADLVNAVRRFAR